MPLSSWENMPLDERLTGSLERFMPMVGFIGSAMDCIAIPQSIPVYPESVESNHWKLVIWLRPLWSRSTMASTSPLAASSSVSEAIFRHLSSPMPAAMPAPPRPERPQLFRRLDRRSASMPQSLRSYLSRATSCMEDTWTPCSVSRTAISEERRLRSSSLRSENDLSFSMPASFRRAATPSTLPLTPRMYGSVSRNRRVIRFPEGMIDPFVLLT